MNSIFRISTTLLMAVCLLSVSFTDKAEARNTSNQAVEMKYERHEKRRNQHKQYRHEARSGHVRVRPVQPALRRPVVVPRKRHVHSVVVIRPYGHAYWGYGHFYADDDAWKWLAFTAITLKILDNIDEASQRAHEAAQITATEAMIGEAIVWHTETSSGSVVATKQGVNQQGMTCREFQQTVTIGNETEQAFGTACLQVDGSWKMV